MSYDEKELKTEIANRTWRPFLYWGLSIVSVLGFPTVCLTAILQPTADLSQIVIAYGMVLAAATGGAYIREKGKNGQI